MAGITDYRQIPPPSSMSLLPEEEEQGWGEWLGSFMPEITFGERPHTPNLPPNTMTVPSGRGPSWEQSGRGQPNAQPLPPPEFIGQPWPGQGVDPSVRMPEEVESFDSFSPPQPPKSPYSFLDNPGASDALVAFGAAMLKAPDFNTGLGDAALAVNRVARENRPIGEAEYARAKQLAMLENIKRGKTSTSEGLQVDTSTTFKSGNDTLFAATNNGQSGMYNATTGEFIPFGEGGKGLGQLDRDVNDPWTQRERRYAAKDAEFEAEYTKNIPAIEQSARILDDTLAIASDPSSRVSSSMYDRVGSQIAVLAPEWGPKFLEAVGGGNFDPNKIAQYDNLIVQAGLEFARQKFQGQGQVTEWERALINKAMAERGTMPRESAIKVLTVMRDAERRKMRMMEIWKSNIGGVKEANNYDFGRFIAEYVWRENERQMAANSGSGSPGSESGGRRPLTDIFN